LLETFPECVALVGLQPQRGQRHPDRIYDELLDGLDRKRRDGFLGGNIAGAMRGWGDPLPGT
jgi:hypothetical protein